MSTLNARSYSTPRNINLKGQGSTRGGILRIEGTNPSNPLGSSTGARGLYVNTSGDLVYSKEGSTTVLGSGGGGASSLDGAYDQGRTITVDAGEVLLTDSTSAAAHTLAINKTGAGSGNLIDLDYSAAATGNTIDIDFTSAVAAQGVVFNSAGGARTGADIVFTDDSTGAHALLDLNKSGAGASIAFDYDNTYAGSPGGQVFTVDFAGSAGLDTEVMQLTVGSGDRGIMFDFNFAHTDVGTTSHVWDIDMSGVFDSNVFDFATTAACTGNVFFLDLDNGVAMTALHIEGSGVRTQPMIEVTTDSTGSAQVFDLDITGAGSGNFIDVLVGAVTYTGNVLDIDLGATGTGSQAVVLTSGIMTRTTALVEIADSGTPSGATMLVSISGASTGPIFDIDISGAHTANVLDITYSAIATGNAINVVMADAVAGAALNITGAGIRTDNLIEVTTSETGSVDGIMLVTASGVFTGHVLTLTTSGAATTGGLVHLNLDAGVAYKALTIDHAGARTVETILVTFDGTFGSGAGGTFLNADISMTGASASPFIDVDVSGVYTGNIFDVLIGASAATGDVISIDLGATATASQAIVIASGAMLRSTALVSLSDAGTSSGATFDINHTGVTTGIIFDIDATAATTGNVFDYASSAASTGTIFEVTLANAVAAKLENYTLSGVRTANASTWTHSASGAVDIWQVDDSGTSSGHVFDINTSGNSTGNVIDIVASASKVAGHFINMDLATDLAGNAINIAAAGTRTAPIINIANAGADGGTDDHVVFISQTGLLDSNLVQLTFGTAASTGEALSVAMGTNVDGRAMYVSSAGTGVSGEGNVLDVLHTGALVAGADVVSIDTTGSISSTSNVLSVTQRTGAGTTGAYALYISATGANVEGLKVDDGAVVFDETLLVTGVATFTAKPVLPIRTLINTSISTHNTTSAINATATATAAEVANGWITSTSAAATTITLPTGTLLGAELGAVAGTVHELYIDNTAGASAVTIAVAVNGVLSTAGVDTAGSFGDLTVASGVTGLARYTIMFSSATAYAFTRTA